MSLPGRLLNIDGVRIFCHRSGPHRRVPIVFAHGYLVGHWAWRHVLPPLANAGHDVIAFDFPGAGESDRPPPAEYGYDASAFVRTLMGVLDALEIERAIVVGHSMGAGVSLLAAAERPERFEQLVAIDPLVYKFSLPLDAHVLLAPLVGQSLFRLLASKWALRRYFRTVYRDPSLVSPEWVDYLFERLSRPGGLEAAHATMQFLVDSTSVEHGVRAVRTPTLIVWGEEDRLFPSAWSQRLAAEIQGAKAVIVPACGHAPAEERPEAVVAILTKFLASVHQPHRAVG